MDTAKVFINGRSQAIRLPKEFRFSMKEVYIKKIDDVVILFPKNKHWEIFEKSLEKFTPDFMDKRKQAKKSDNREKL